MKPIVQNLEEAEASDTYELIAVRDGLVFYLDHSLNNIELYRQSTGEHITVIGRKNFEEISYIESEMGGQV